MLYALLLSALLIAAPLFAAPGLDMNDWLVAGPAALPAPAFADSADPLTTLTLDAERLRPEKGAALALWPGHSLTWKAQRGMLRLGKGTTFAAVYLVVPRSETVTLHIEAPGTVRLWLDGELKQSGSASLDITERLHRGKHTLLLAVAAKSGGPLTARLTAEDGSPVALTTDPRRALAEFKNVTLFDALSEPTLSADGGVLAVLHAHRNAKLVKETWIEIYDAATSKLLHTLRPVKSPGNLFFFPNSQKLGFTTAAEKGSTLWSFDLATGETTPLARELEGLARIALSPDGQTLYYTADAEPEESEAAYELWDELEDRMDDWTSHRRLFALNLESGARTALTAEGDFALDEFALSREGNQLLFTRRLTRVGRPYYSTEFWLYDVKAGKARKVLTQSLPFETRPVSLTWLPGGKQLAYVTASYETVAADTVRGLTNAGLWLLDVATGTSENLTIDAPFSLAESDGRSAILWNAATKRLWFKVLAGGAVRLFETDPLAAPKVFTEIPLALPFIDEYDVAASGLCALVASDPVTPAALYVYDTAPRLVTAPSKDVLPTVELSKYERWNFTNSAGHSIDGWLFYPPEYKPELSRSWPLVVYYYGGVSPRDERFNYTYHWWAANGYMLYVLNPTGAVGYGQDVADLHSNDWGTRATQDILEGVDSLLQAKPFIDGARMAAYGGSYGGFITLDLATKTDRFAALCSDAGISNIASYFGGGAWGFTYGDIALPGAFPWNRPDIFAGKSPLFHADKIQSPLLLIHGLDDNNVPAQESAQMFTALKLLGRDVAYVRFPGEDHSIALKYSNYMTYREMMLEWFDKHLKQQPAAWDARWKE